MAPKATPIRKVVVTVKGKAQRTRTAFDTVMVKAPGRPKIVRSLVMATVVGWDVLAAVVTNRGKGFRSSGAKVSVLD